MKIKQLFESAGSMSTGSIATAPSGVGKMVRRQNTPADNALDDNKLFAEGGVSTMTPNWAKYVLDQIYNSDGAVTLTDLFDEGIPGLHDMFMATAEAHGFDPEEDFEDVQHELTVELEDIVKGGHDVAEAKKGVSLKPRNPTMAGKNPGRGTVTHKNPKTEIPRKEKHKGKEPAYEDKLMSRLNKLILK
jgi:hypothetical protein